MTSKTCIQAAVQRALIQCLLDGEGMPGIARIVARHAQAEVGMLTADLQLVAHYPHDGDIESLLPIIGSAVGKAAASDSSTLSVHSAGRWLSLRPVVTGSHRAGWVCMARREKPDDATEFAIAQAALGCALSQLEQRAASEEILWDGRRYAFPPYVTTLQALVLE